MITALVVMYNAEKILDDHFQSLWFCDEIIAIDIGSSDGSIDVAKRYNCKVVHHPWVPMGEMAWVHYINEAKYDWIMISDPDEIVTPILGGRIKYKIDHVSPTTGTVSLPYRHYFLGKRINTSMWKDIHYIPKIFHRDRVDVKCTVHSPFTIKSGYNNIWLKTDLDDDTEVVLHYPAENIVYLLMKLTRYALLEGESRFKRGEIWSVDSCIRSIARSIYYHFKSTHGLHKLSGMFLGTTFITYDIASQFSLWLYQRRYNIRGLEILQIEPTRRCNMHCKHCSRTEESNEYIDIETFKHILQSYPYVKTIKLQGLGEPLLHPNINQLIQLSRDHGSRVMIITNGSLPIPEGIDDVVVSLETIDPVKYENLRGYSIIPVLNNIKDIATKQHVTLNCVQTHLTTPTDVNNVCNFALENGTNIWITPMEVWVDELHDDYSESFDNAERAAQIHGITHIYRCDTCQWMKKYRYFDYLGREHPCCIRMTDEYILHDDFDLYQCCKNCPM